MISVIILAALIVLDLFALAWAMERAARAVGSPRGQLRWGLVAVVAMTLIGLAILRATFLVASQPAAVKLLCLAIWVAGICADFWALKFIFRLTARRNLAPFGAHFAMSSVLMGTTVLVVIPYLIEAFIEPTRAMSPTIEPRGRFVVNKWLSPRRWDLVVYQSEDPAPSFFCKRLIGLPGEKLRFAEGKLHINNQPVSPPDVLAGRLHASVPDLPSDEVRYTEGEDISLSADEYFFIGDNVDVSKDSRYQGPSPRSSIVGVIDLIYWPLGRARIVR